MSKNNFNKKDLSRLLKSVLIIEGKIGEIRFRQKDFKGDDIELTNDALLKLEDSFGVKTPNEFTDFIKSLY